jgi:hypothetical protein
MTRSYLLAAVAAAAMTLPLSATAAPSGDAAFDAFRTLCADTGDDYPAVVKAATADGWQTAEVLADDLPGVSITDKSAWAKGTGSSEVRMRVTRGLKTVKTGDVTISTCTVSTDNAPTGLLDRAKAWLNMAPMDLDPSNGKVAYLLTVDGSSRVVLAQADIEAAMNKGGAHLLKFKQDGQSEVLDYERFSK